MTDIIDPQAVEEASQAEQNNYKIYRRRWLVLFAMFSVILTVGLHKSLMSIVDTLDDYMGTTIDKYDLMTQVSMISTSFSVIFVARALEYFGLRRMAYFACLMIVFANGLKILFCCSEKYVSQGIVQNRFYILLLSEAFLGIAGAITVCVPAKVASAWFAHYENTLALMIINCGYNIGVGFSNYFTPIFIQSTGDMYKLCYLFLVSGFLTTLIVLTCVTRSSPKMPPSSSAIMSSSSSVPFRSGVAVMLSNPSYVLLILTLSLNQSAMGAVQLVLEDILKIQKYNNSFCGTLIAHSYFFGAFFMLMGGAWIDNSANYVKVSRIACAICALAIFTFNISLLLPNIKNVILTTNILAAFGSSLIYPALLQVAFRSAMTILPEGTVAAIAIIVQQTATSIMMNLLGPLKKLSPPSNEYLAPMILFACLVMLVNMFYVTSFKAPSRDKLQRKLRSDDRDVLVNEE